MAAKTGIANSDVLLNSHEDRIQRIEENLPDLGENLARCVIKIDKLADDMEDQHAFTNAQLEKVLEMAQSSVDDRASQRKRLEAMELHHQERVARWTKLKSSGVWAVAVAVGSIITKFGESIWTWLRDMHV